MDASTRFWGYFWLFLPMMYSCIALAARLPAPMALMIVVAPLTTSPPAYTPSMLVRPVSSSTTMVFHLVVSRFSVVLWMTGFGFCDGDGDPLTLIVDSNDDERA